MDEATAVTSAEELLADWQASCRAHDVLRNLPVPVSQQLVQDVAARVCGGAGGAPDAVLRAHASGLAAVDWHASGEVLQLQVGLLMQVIAGNSDADHRRLAHVHTIMSAAAAGTAVEAWRDRAEQDELTELRNRAGWERDCLAFVAAKSMTYASIDLDGLKAINDGPGGHAAGDELLRSFARRLEIAVSGAGGSAYRYGGDEFSAVLLAEGGDLDEILFTLSSTSGVTPFSHGVATWPDEDEDLQTIVSTADRRMYESKRLRKLKASAPSD